MTDRCTFGRIGISAAILFLAFAGLGSRLAFLHLGDHDEHRANIQGNRRVTRTISARRGRILERSGKDTLLAVDMAVRDVCADPSRIAQEKAVVSVVIALSEILKIPADEVAVKLKNSKRRFTYIKRFVDQETTEKIEALSLPGVFFERAQKRFYPQNDMFCHVLGFVNYEGVGSAGVEQTMRKYLRGSPGSIESKVDALRREVFRERGRYIPGMEGADVWLTIDQNVQYIAERALDDVMREQKAKGAWAIVQRVKTGEILAMASRPSYDPNRFTRSRPDDRLNRCIGFVYEPGSTFKAITISAALNEGTVTANTVFDCEHGCWYYGGKPLRDFHAYGPLSVADGLKKSSNILAAKVALTLGDKRFYHYLQEYGIGQASGITLPGEEVGILAPPSKWSKIDSTRIAMGHSVAATALQVLGVFSTIANNGVRMRPYIVKKVERQDGTVLYEGRPRALAQPIRPDVAKTMQGLLARVTEQGGTGRRARVDNYSVAGKTGTAEKIIDGRYSKTANIASFVGFLPATKPELSIIVVVDEPQKSRTGGVVAGPYFGQIATEAVRYLCIAPDLTPPEQGDTGHALVARRSTCQPSRNLGGRLGVMRGAW
ncbi:MAG: penicillin-binding protein 2 [Kiritimatiellae bacterium]|nr:penicillin-binding protein 2 [Kiritimatiellia bacterium]